VIDNALVLTMLRYADELVDTAQLEFPADAKVRKAELDMARMLVENLAADWDPSKYTDEYRDNLMKLIKARLKGQPARLPAAGAPPDQGKVVDLMERLRQSLDARTPGRAARKRSRPMPTSKKKRSGHAA